MGVDIEWIDYSFDWSNIKNKVFNEDEISFFKHLDKKSRIEFFYQLWVCKESILKAMGLGFHSNPQHIELLIDHGGKATLLSHHKNQWKLYTCRHLAGYQLAVALPLGCEIKLFEYSMNEALISTL